jgi:DNA polymerase-4
VRYADFTSVTRAATLAFPTQSPDLITETAIRLLQRTDAAKKRVRLLGIAVSKLDEWEAAQTPVATEGAYVQRTLFGD